MAVRLADWQERVNVAAQVDIKSALDFFFDCSLDWDFFVEIFAEILPQLLCLRLCVRDFRTVATVLFENDDSDLFAVFWQLAAEFLNGNATFRAIADVDKDIAVRRLDYSSVYNLTVLNVQALERLLQLCLDFPLCLRFILFHFHLFHK